MQNPIFVLKKYLTRYWRVNTPAKWTAAVHRVLLTKPPETRLTEHMATRVNLEGLVEDVETHGAEQILMDLGQFRLSLKKRLNIDI